MDEYLFITLAKLKADRLTLKRERRRLEADPEQLHLELPERLGVRRSPVLRAIRDSAPARWFSQQPLWREQS